MRTLVVFALVAALGHAQEDPMAAMQAMLGGKGGDMAEQMKAIQSMMAGKGGGDMGEQLKAMMGNIDKDKIKEQLKSVMGDGKLKDAMKNMGSQLKNVMKDDQFHHVMKHTAKQLHQHQKHASKAIAASGQAEMVEGEAAQGEDDAAKKLGGLGGLGALGDHFKDLFEDEELKEHFKSFANEYKEVMADGEMKDVFDGFGHHFKQAQVDDQKSSLASLLMNAKQKRSEM